MIVHLVHVDTLPMVEEPDLLVTETQLKVDVKCHGMAIILFL